MLRIIFIGALIYFIYKLLKRSVIKTQKVPNPDKTKSLEAGEMVACAKCETFVLKTEAFESKGKFYCSKTCVG
ncbi:MAG: hypothetical protein COS89_08860 [Deltaproteobacteria bacterium CG07_land_8_20_14_0_80_38_7]|nr:MAG: hypothetical protein COS89_08860 [Deltaproteobacteria bacterium CG07_land_8_20_14_0_80_38_7]